MTHFKLNDYVAVYDAGVRFTGTVYNLKEGDIICILLSHGMSFRNVHPKQCRKLVKKPPRRRLWIEFSRPMHLPCGSGFPAYETRPHPVKDAFAEFIEVRKK